MAKAKKPASGSNSPSKPDQDAGKPSDVVAAKADGAVDPKKVTPEVTPKADAKKPAPKAPDAKTAEAKPAEPKAAEPAKTAASSSSVPKTGKAVDASVKATAEKVEAVKASPEKPASSVKEASQKPDSQKPVETKGASDASKVASVASKPTQAAKPEAVAKAVEAKTTPPAAPAEPKKSVFWPLVFGGVVAAALGFAASEMNVFNTRVDTDAINATLGTQGDRIATLEAVEAPVIPEMPEMPDLSGLETSIAAISETVTAMEARLAELEARPIVIAEGDDGAAALAFAKQFEALEATATEQLDALQSSVVAQKEEIQRLLDNAISVEQATADAARDTAAQTALTAITAALATGEDYSEALAALTASGIEDVPAALAENAAGVPLVQTLQSEFPATARAALSAVRASGDDGAAAGVGSFLRRQLGARSVAPREGDDPDAVLSRAEAAVRQGDLAAALSEIETLPEGAQAAMADWLAAAQARAGTQAAVQDLSQRLTAN